MSSCSGASYLKRRSFRDPVINYGLTPWPRGRRGRARVPPGARCLGGRCRGRIPKKVLKGSLRESLNQMASGLPADARIAWGTRYAPLWDVPTSAP